MLVRLAVHDIKVKWNSGLSSKARFTLHALHILLVRCVCPFIEATHIKHYHNSWYSSPTNNGRSSLSQICWYRAQLLTEPKFRIFRRLVNEYLVDMFSRVEEE